MSFCYFLLNIENTVAYYADTNAHFVYYHNYFNRKCMLNANVKIYLLLILQTLASMIKIHSYSCFLNV